ncbi:uncharacterized protein LOC143280608 [Babylonia areolata]|uniref:uncharacterized protein LOC143280608 n=1 Tax=Babylonia areolata TaxID=304850 RepID=UPI003FCF7C8F
MAQQDPAPLIPTTEAQPTSIMAEELHPVTPEERCSASRGSNLKGDISRERKEEDTERGPGTTTTTTTPTQKRRLSCPVHFGVRSYLHQFYDKQGSYKDPAVYEDDDDDNLDYRSSHTRTPSRRRRRRCSCCRPVWWKVFLWVGVQLLGLGVVGILVGYLVPQRPLVVGENPEAGEWYLDPGARPFNAALDACRLAGLGLFCLGGVTLALSLLFPTFLHYCRDDDEYDENYLGAGVHGDDGDGCKVPLRGGGEEGVGLGMSIPATSTVQPPYRAPRSPIAGTLRH